MLREAPAGAIGWAYFWGAMWGLGGLTFGLTMRYLGMSLGMAVALSYCSVFGTLMPPLFDGTLVEKFSTTSGHWIGFGIIVCVLGIVVTGMAGMSKDREMSEEKKREAIKEFNFWKGILVATFSGIMSASFAYGSTQPSRSPRSPPVTARRPSGRACRNSASCCSAASRPTSSGASC